TSLLLHLASTTALTIFLYQLFGNVFAAAIAGLIFALHPTSVECVAWLAERKALLGTFFAFTSLIFYIRHVQLPKKKTYLLCIFFFILSMLSKPNAVGLPLVMLFLDYWPLNRFGKKALLEKIPIFILSIIFALITYISQAETSIIVTPSGRGVSAVVLLFFHNITFYLHKFLCPINLSPRYPLPQPFNLGNPALGPYVLGTVMLSVAIVLSLRRTRVFLTCFLVFFIALVNRDSDAADLAAENLLHRIRQPH
ncbi:MAG: hypothetical protein ACYST9_07845, partial [Planctomycetota bacterium]